MLALHGLKEAGFLQQGLFYDVMDDHRYWPSGARCNFSQSSLFL